MTTTTVSAASVIVTTVFLLLLLNTANASTTSTPILGLDSFLSQQSRLDPQATNDSFLYLSSPLKKSLSSNLRPPPTSSSLLSLKISVPVYVKLVGPSSSFPSTSPSIFSSFLTAAISSDHYHVITPFSSNTNHRLSLTHFLALEVDLSSPSLSSKLSDKIKSEIATTASPLRSNLISISYTTIDSIIKQDFEKEKPTKGVYIYLLNLGSQSKPYAYKYTDTGESSLGVTKCSGSIWTGKDRYLWIDLSAGPVDYGPALSGDGVLPRGEFHPLTALHGTSRAFFENSCAFREHTDCSVYTHPWP
ncbi:unnamed protein product [Lactuca saligna]|uniref:DUF7906 domain-containing protein n=1 Tax=Lactuca saligna TaxID=75948 RepID=A0AA35YF17_LACSI|nr:unnamed protein product [Lactuca saligna]